MKAMPACRVSAALDESAGANRNNFVRAALKLPDAPPSPVGAELGTMAREGAPAQPHNFYLAPSG
jgi:hypothetical protein